MGEFHRFSRARPRAPRRIHLSYCVFPLALSFIVFILFSFYSLVSPPSHSCLLPPHHIIRPKLMFVSLANSTSISSSVKGLTNFDTQAKTCIFRLYTTSEHDFEGSASKYHATCVGLGGGCMIDVKFVKDARMWGDISLEDVSPATTVVFLRSGARFTTRAMDWLMLAHKGIRRFYEEGGRRDYVAAVIGCDGEKSLTPWWSHTAGPLNTTCAFAPVRGGREDLWIFFVKWYAARRREWVTWPSIWDDDNAVPVFWRSSNRNRRDTRLEEFGERVGLDYEWVGKRELLWERWYPRWASNYSMRVLSAEWNMGVGYGKEKVRKEVLLPPVSSERLLRTESGDVVAVGSLWYEPSDAELGNGYFEALKKIVGDKPPMVSLTIVNENFIELTKSWVCNVKAGGFVPPNIYWIALDAESQQALTKLGVGQTVDITDALSGENMDAINIIYGQPAYWKLMLMRTRLIRDLLDRGIDVFLFETDQVWLQNPFDYIGKELRAGADMVGTLDTQHNIAGNTLLLKSVISTKRMWSEVYRRFRISYDDKQIKQKPIHSVTFVNHDQFQLSAMLLYDTAFTQDFPVALGLLNSQLFVGGSWYSGKYESEVSKKPIIINNNFLSGTKKKRTRAKTFGHWFLKNDGETCDTLAVTKALRYEFARLPGIWWEQKQRRMAMGDVKKDKISKRALAFGARKNAFILGNHE